MNASKLITGERDQKSGTPGKESGSADVELTDTELVERCQQKKTSPETAKSAFNTLITRHRGKAYGMIYNMVRNEEDAWDLAQDGFLKVWKSIDQFRCQSSFSTWLYRIMFNLTIDWLRKQQAYTATEFEETTAINDAAANIRVAPAPTPSPSRSLERNELRAQIDAAIAQLSPEHRAVLLLTEFEGYQYREVAQILEIPLGTVMSRLFHARKKLQHLLKPIYEDL